MVSPRWRWQIAFTLWALILATFRVDGAPVGRMRLWSRRSSTARDANPRIMQTPEGDDVAHPAMAAALASRSSRLHGGRISAVTCGVPLLVRVHRRRQRHEHSVLTDPVDEAGWLQDHP